MRTTVHVLRSWTALLYMWIIRRKARLSPPDELILSRQDPVHWSFLAKQKLSVVSSDSITYEDRLLYSRNQMLGLYSSRTGIVAVEFTALSEIVVALE